VYTLHAAATKRIVSGMMADWDPSEHPRVPAGSPQGGEVTEGDDASSDGKERDHGGGNDFGHVGVPASRINPDDGGVGPSIQYHGTSAPDFSAFKPDEPVYLQDDSGEARGYALGGHTPGRKGSGKPRILYVRRRPGRTKDLTDAVNDAVMEEDDADAKINELLHEAKRQGFRYASFEHPSFYKEQEQHVLVSLHPDEDLREVAVVRARRPRQALRAELNRSMAEIEGLDDDPNSGAGRDAPR
jgi:hypothetical protein